MEREPLEEKVGEGWSIYQLANHFALAPTTIRYWLKKFDLKTKNLSFSEGYRNTPKRAIVNNQKFCPQCNAYRSLSDFYLRQYRKTREPMGWCKACCNQTAIMRQRETKRLAVEYKGGCCQICSYDQYVGALEFHHIDPSMKDPSWKALKSASFNSVKAELDKCALLCANCHREVHAGIAILPTEL